MDDDEAVGPMTFGKYAGVTIDEIPSRYLLWLIRSVPLRDERLRDDVEYVLFCRGHSLDEIEGV